MCVALYPPPEVGGFTATGDKYKDKKRRFKRLFLWGNHLVIKGSKLIYCCSSRCSNCSLIPTVLNPASTNKISPVMPEAQGDNKNKAALPTSI